MPVILMSCLPLNTIFTRADLHCMHAAKPQQVKILILPEKKKVELGWEREKWEPLTYTIAQRYSSHYLQTFKGTYDEK